MTIHDRATTISERQTMAADLAKAGLALFGPDWKAPLAAALTVRTSSIDDMSSGRSRIPPAMWNEIAGMIQDRERQLPIIKAAILEHAGRPVHRLYRGPDGIEFGIEPEIGGAFPLVHFTQTWPQVQWQTLGDDQRRFPDGTVAICLEHNGFVGEIVMMQIGSTVRYPPLYLRVT